MVKLLKNLSRTSENTPGDKEQEFSFTPLQLAYYTFLLLLPGEETSILS